MTPASPSDPRLLHLGRDGIALAVGKPGAASASDPFAAGRQVVFADEAGHRAGQLRLSGSVLVEGLGHAEILIVAAGKITVSGKAHPVGTAFVLPRGFAGEVIAQAGTLAFFVTQENAELDRLDSPPQPVLLDPALPRNPSPGPAADLLIGPAANNHALNLFTDTSGMRAGIWDASTPCERRIVPHRIHELMGFLEGEVILTHRDGTITEFRGGDVIFVPQGAPYAWKNAVKVVKIYVVSG